jgi:hypothetical protein
MLGAHALDDVGVVLDRAGADAVGDAGDDAVEEDDRDDAAEERRAQQVAVGGVAQEAGARARADRQRPRPAAA